MRNTITRDNFANASFSFSEISLWQEAKRGMAVAGKVNVTPSEEKTVDEEPLVYASKQVCILDFMSLSNFSLSCMFKE